MRSILRQPPSCQSGSRPTPAQAREIGTPSGHSIVIDGQGLLRTRYATTLYPIADFIVTGSWQEEIYSGFIRATARSRLGLQISRLTSYENALACAHRRAIFEQSKKSRRDGAVRRLGIASPSPSDRAGGPKDKKGTDWGERGKGSNRPIETLVAVWGELCSSLLGPSKAHRRRDWLRRPLLRDRQPNPLPPLYSGVRRKRPLNDRSPPRRLTAMRATLPIGPHPRVNPLNCDAICMSGCTAVLSRCD